MDEASLEASLVEYKGQVTQMELAISVTEDEPTRQELRKLKDELLQLVQLTEGKITSIKYYKDTNRCKF